MDIIFSAGGAGSCSFDDSSSNPLPSASCGWVNLERLLRYWARPPFAIERLAVIRGEDGRIVLVRRRNNRPTRVLQGGIVSVGNRPPPCTLRNSSGSPLARGLPEAANNTDEPPEDDQGGGRHPRHKEHPDGAAGSAAGSKNAPSDRKGGSTGARRTSRGGVRPSPADRQTPRQPSETGRLYKASRGDPRRAFPDEAAPSQNAREIHRSLPVPLPVPDLVRRGCGSGAIGVSA